MLIHLLWHACVMSEEVEPSQKSLFGENLTVYIALHLSFSSGVPTEICESVEGSSH